jgi:hypothetical protein
MIPGNKNRSIFSIALLALLVTVNYYCSQPTAKDDSANTAAPKEMTASEKLARGRYLVTLGGCNDCHTPKVFTATGPVFDSTRILSGHPAGSPLPEITYDASKPGNWMLFAPDLTAAAGPWGISFSANLTPDSTTGIGAWTTENFIKTIRTGKHLGMEGGRPILPPMPWQSMAEITDEDLSLIFGYLKSLPPIKNQVPAPVPPTDLMKKK